MDPSGASKPIDCFLRECKILAEYFDPDRKSIPSRGILGELLVVRKLLQRGRSVTYRGGAKKGADILVKSADGQAVSIGVKEETGEEWVRLDLHRYWMMPEVRKGERQRVTVIRPNQPDFYVLVDSKRFLN